MRILLNEENDIHTREIARRLHLPSSTVHYHLMRLVKRGVLTKEVVDDTIMRAYYTPQPIFTENIEETLHLLDQLALKVKGDELANCIDMFQQCYDQS